MPSQIGKLKYVALVLLLIGCGFSVAYNLMYAVPKKKCEDRHGWYSFKYHTCEYALRLVKPVAETTDK